MRRGPAWWTALGTLVMLTACANTARSPEPPELGLSAADRFVAADADAPQPGPDDLAWWQRFDDPALSVWIERALSRNLDLALARTRVDEARALLRAAQAGRAPQLGGQAQLVARNRAAGQGRRIEPSVGLTLDWDANLWGELASTEAPQPRGSVNPRPCSVRPGC